MLGFIAFLNEEDELEEKGLTLQGRRKLARTMKRRKTQLKLARKRARRRLAGRNVIKRRARRSVRGDLAKKLAGGKSKASLSIAKKKEIERKLGRANHQRRIAYITKRTIPKKRRAELLRKKR